MKRSLFILGMVMYIAIFFTIIIIVFFGRSPYVESEPLRQTIVTSIDIEQSEEGNVILREVNKPNLTPNSVKEK